MTDEQMTRACANAMGWHWNMCVIWKVGEFQRCSYAWTNDEGLFVAPPDWDPLTIPRDTMNVLNAIAHLHPQITYDDTLCVWWCECLDAEGDTKGVGDGFEGFGRSIIVSALKAFGIALSPA